MHLRTNDTGSSLVMSVTPISSTSVPHPGEQLLLPGMMENVSGKSNYHLAVVNPWSQLHDNGDKDVNIVITSESSALSSESNSWEDEQEGIQFWKTYFQFAYYMLVCPFRFEWDEKARSYYCFTSKLQTILHRTIFAIFGICYLLRLRVMWYVATTSGVNKNNATSVSSSSYPEPTTGSKENTTAYFDMTVYFFDSFFMLILFLHFGRQKNLVFDVFKEFQPPQGRRDLEKFRGQFIISNDLSNNKYRKTRFWSTVILVVCMSTVALKLIEVVQNEGWDLRIFFSSKIAESKLMFFHGSMVEAVPWLFVSLNLGSTLYEKVLNDFGDILFTMSVLLLNNLVEQFVLSMKEGRDSIMVLRHYHWLKGVTTKINFAIGTMTFAFIAGNLPFFATTVLEVFGTETKNVFVRVRYIVACSYFFPSICIGAMANKKVDDVKEWICREENYQKIPETKLVVFLHDLTFHSVGLTAKGIVTVNWNSVGSIISIILTYALLKSQFK